MFKDFDCSNCQLKKQWQEKEEFLPSDIALINIVKARTKIISDALPVLAILLSIMYCPIKAPITATTMK